jgi:hypothetical protein
MQWLVLKAWLKGCKFNQKSFLEQVRPLFSWRKGWIADRRLLSILWSIWISRCAITPVRLIWHWTVQSVQYPSSCQLTAYWHVATWHAGRPKALFYVIFLSATTSWRRIFFGTSIFLSWRGKHGSHRQNEWPVGKLRP